MWGGAEAGRGGAGSARGSRTRLAVTAAWVRALPCACAALPARAQSTSDRRAARTSRDRCPSAPRSPRSRPLAVSYQTIYSTVLLFIWTILTVHMVHLVDILRSANVEYPPPPVIVSKQLSMFCWLHFNYFHFRIYYFYSAFLLFQIFGVSFYLVLWGF